MHRLQLNSGWLKINYNNPMFYPYYSADAIAPLWRCWSSSLVACIFKWSNRSETNYSIGNGPTETFHYIQDNNMQNYFVAYVTVIFNNELYTYVLLHSFIPLIVWNLQKSIYMFYTYFSYFSCIRWINGFSNYKTAVGKLKPYYCADSIRSCWKHNAFCV